MKKTNESTQEAFKTMEEMVADLQLQLVESENTIKSKDTIISALHHQLFLLKNAKFGRKSEKLEEDKQLDLGFDEAELLAAQDCESADVIETKTVTIKKKKPGRKPLPTSMPYIEHIHDISDAEKHCDCGCTLTHIGNETREQLDVLPQVTYRVIHIRKKYACKSCEETITTAKLPKQPFPKSIATAGLVATVIDAKFNRHLPLYRQEDIFKSMGAEISRTNLGNWVIKAAELLKPIVWNLKRLNKKLGSMRVPFSCGYFRLGKGGTCALTAINFRVKPCFFISQYRIINNSPPTFWQFLCAI